MTKKTAIDYLVALACCSSPKLTCEDCPLRDEGCKFSEDDIVKAVKVLNSSAEVAPKSEVERLEHLRAELSKEVDRLKDDNKFLQDRRFKEWNEVRREVAREIFGEIKYNFEDLRKVEYANAPLQIVFNLLDYLEKKYTEGE
jgi:hypothetical protein